MTRSRWLALGVGLLAAACAGTDGALMTWREYKDLDHPIPYVVRLSHPAGGELLFFGSRHSFQPEHPQTGQIMGLWEEFRPTLAFFEGGGPVVPPGDTLETAIRRGAEPGLVRYLAQRDGVRVESPEPDAAAEVANLSGRFTAEQIKLFYVLRQISQYVTYEGRDLGAPLEERVQDALDAIGGYPGLEGRPRDLEELETVSRELLPTLDGWRNVTREYFRPNPDAPVLFTNWIAAETGDFRDLHIIERITDAVRSGERLFIVMGSSHAVRQEHPLRREIQGQAPRQRADSRATRAPG